MLSQHKRASEPVSEQAQPDGQSGLVSERRKRGRPVGTWVEAALSWLGEPATYRQIERQARKLGFAGTLERSMLLRLYRQGRVERVEAGKYVINSGSE